eukprot:CAMPEP_0119034006 /NCGR_PEP_ID=MMETSP1177-20130426/1065_1 /TAXON_ID=2985 /ORGANISM="Ochromonas sp, Strain CCMP1899" /LENGTH=565 /DNA_ID=CAMNT_0006991175 /DNA_START=644 /DNA_END=2344 /DNA_ORIENTATION=-
MNYYAQTKDKGLGVTAFPPTNGITSVFSYTNIWDANKIYGCNCDAKYEGSDCSVQKCPVGDDPLTGNGVNTVTNPIQVNAIQQVSCKAGGGTFTLAYNGATTNPIPYNAKGPDIVLFLSALSTLRRKDLAVVRVVMFGTQACLEAGTAFTVEFLQEFGNLNIMVSSKTNLFFLNALSVPFVVVTKRRAGTKEDLFCSNRGLCDFSTGYCTCSINYDTSNGYALPGTRGDCGDPTTTIAVCPGLISCSSHGVCAGSPTYACACSAGWVGADCSQRLCPRSQSWFSYPSAIDVAHVATPAECGNQGQCDRATGQCLCNIGFYGESCEYLSCGGVPQQCNGNGQCLDMTALAPLADINGDNAFYTYGTIPNNPATWDGSKVHGCHCDKGYIGYDCSQMSCPFGDDPGTRNQFDEQQIISCTDTDATGSIFITFRQQKTAAIPATATMAQLTTALQSLSTIQFVTVDNLQSNTTDSICSKIGTTILVTFLTEHGDLPLMTSPPNLNIGINSLTINQNVRGTKENIECSGRGMCNRILGLCECFSGYGSSNGMGKLGINGDCGFLEPYVG